MAKMRVLILGAGFGGLELASRLSDEAPGDVDVTLIDRSDAFVFGFSKLDVMFGRTDLASVRAPYRYLHKPGVTFRQETITAIDPERKRVTTDAGTYDGDILVVALGAELDPAATPGLLAGGHEFYSVAGAERLASVLPTFTSGHAVIGVMGTPYKCPPAPSETALLLHDYLVARGCRDTFRISIVSPLGTPVPPSPETATALLEAFSERDITYLGGETVTALDPGRHTVSLASGGELDYDLFLGVPLHRAPHVVDAAGLLDHGWVGVHPRTLVTPFAGVYALGDVANAPVPRAGVFAESAAQVVADDILAQLHDTPTSLYDGYGACYIEFGAGRVARVELTFITDHGPQSGAFSPPSVELARDKVHFRTSRLERWFGDGLQQQRAGAPERLGSGQPTNA